MQKKEKNTEEVKTEACEIIELAINDIETLARAFDLIATVSSKLPNPQLRFDTDKPESAIN